MWSVPAGPLHLYRRQSDGRKEGRQTPPPSILVQCQVSPGSYKFNLLSERSKTIWSSSKTLNSFYLSCEMKLWKSRLVRKCCQFVDEQCSNSLSKKLYINWMTTLKCKVKTYPIEDHRGSAVKVDTRIGLFPDLFTKSHQQLKPFTTCHHENFGIYGLWKWSIQYLLSWGGSSDSFILTQKSRFFFFIARFFSFFFHTIYIKQV